MLLSVIYFAMLLAIITNVLLGYVLIGVLIDQFRVWNRAWEWADAEATRRVSEILRSRDVQMRRRERRLLSPPRVPVNRNAE